MTDTQEKQMREKQEQINAALLALRHRGRLTPDEVVRAARPASSPLHDSFEWDDSKAGARWRQEQARILIRSVEIRTTTSEGESVVQKVFVRDPLKDEAEQGYVSIDQLKKEPASAREAVHLEFVRAEACMTRAETLAAVLGIVPTIRTIKRKLVSGRKQLEKEATA